MKFSPFNPVCFHKTSVPKDAGTDFAHVFADSDCIFFEVFHSPEEPLSALSLLDATTGENLHALGWNTYGINSEERVSSYELRGMPPGDYLLSFGEYISNSIHITSDPAELGKTILIQYCVGRNTERKDVYQWINHRPRYFELRVVGGFKDGGWKFGVDNEQFETENADLVETYAMESTDKILTIGESDGSNRWIGAKIEKVMLCKYIFIDGERYSVSGDRRILVLEGTQSENRMVNQVQLRRVRYLGARVERDIQMTLRKIPAHLRKSGMRNLRAI